MESVNTIVPNVEPDVETMSNVETMITTGTD